MREVGSFEAKTHLPRLIDEVLRGERVVITRRGKQVAMLVPMGDRAQFDGLRAGRRLRALREGVTWAAGDDSSVRDAIDAGRR